MNDIKKHEGEILQILCRETKPMGSGQLRALLLQRGFNLSEATVGRILCDMDLKDLTEKLGFKGRQITDHGRKTLERVNIASQQSVNSSRLLKLLNSTRREDLIDMLAARRAIERELARLASLNATANEIKQLEAVLYEQEQLALRNEMSAEQDLSFHRLIATAAKNKVLAAALDLIRQGRQMPAILEYIRKEVQGAMAVEHVRVLRAIISRDPEKAEQAMVEHIDSLISDVEKYWQGLNKNKAKTKTK
ncbi:MAG: hypothetical protein VR67_13130 [Peptococcaceae bacterium BRH_c8a]|nr:MAG: hypothetical protein VR67_13130 [Peptococcaceae bacterium BRH_c8a]